jgi:predicted HAD superfamily Cof-like phosphohydrolase
VAPLHAGTRLKKTQRAQAAAGWQNKKLGEPKIKRELSSAKKEPEKKNGRGKKRTGSALRN